MLNIVQWRGNLGKMFSNPSGSILCTTLPTDAHHPMSCSRVSHCLPSASQDGLEGGYIGFELDVAELPALGVPRSMKMTKTREAQV